MTPPKDPEVVREEATQAFIQVAFDDGWALREEYHSYVARRKANREQLRSLAAQGKLSEDQETELAELYPKHRKDAEEAEEASVTQEPIAA